MKFADLRLSEPILRAVHAQGYTIPTPVQMEAIPHVLDGKDLLACAQTGTGKTAAFALPILHRLSSAAAPAKGVRRKPRALILSPTRELAVQIAESFADYGRQTGLKHVVIYGGVNQNPQTKSLHNGVDIIVATPGRLIDLTNQGFLDYSGIEVFVLDEADRLLDMGFIPDIRRVVAKLPRERQTLLFSATMPEEIRQLAAAVMRDPVRVQVAATSAAADTVEQSVYHVEQRNKPHLLTHVLQSTAGQRVLVFTRTKHGADRVAKTLSREGIHAEAIHGNKTQSARRKALERFKSRQPPVLVATDIAARGLDIDEISHVINYDLPNIPETYVHRIGRTGRAGASGVAVSFCQADERSDLKAIEKLIRQTIPVQKEQPAYPPPGKPATSRPGKPAGGQRKRTSTGANEGRAPKEGRVAAAGARPFFGPKPNHGKGPADGVHRSRGRKRSKARGKGPDPARAVRA
jgi:ATP-dependent RNA helicase RhlE